MKIERTNMQLNVNEIYFFGGLGVRVIGTTEEPWFNASDVCCILDWIDTDEALNQYVDIQDKITFRNIPNKGRREHPAVYVNVYGLKSLIFSTRDEEGHLPFDVELFRKWVVNDLIPSIKKEYITTTADKIKDLEHQIKYLEEQRDKLLQL